MLSPLVFFLYHNGVRFFRLLEIDMTEPKKPPMHLVKTWIWMMTASDDDELKASGQEKLIAAFGSMIEVQKYLEEHDKQ